VHRRPPLLATSQGSMQVLDGGGAFVGWGSEPYYTQFAANGTEVLDGRFATGTSYRAFRYPWTGRPATRPSVALERPVGRPAAVYASWNGATDVTSWRVLGGPSSAAMTTVVEVGRQGFETVVPLLMAPAAVAVQALDRAGTVLGRSRTVVTA